MSCHTQVVLQRETMAARPRRGQDFVSEDYKQMMRCFFLSQENAAEAARIYGRFFPNARQPDERTITGAVRRFFDQAFEFPKRVDAGRPRHVLAPEVEEEIEDAFEADPSTSVRQVSRETGVSVSRVHAVISDTGKHPFHLRKVQKLIPGDYVRRTDFCEGFLAQIRANDDFLFNILWTDECTFTRNGCFNQHNTHYWALENPHLTRVTKFQHQWSINVWAGILDGKIVSIFLLLYFRINIAPFLVGNKSTSLVNMLIKWKHFSLKST